LQFFCRVGDECCLGCGLNRRFATEKAKAKAKAKAEAKAEEMVIYKKEIGETNASPIF
jgi:hypothetical protein